MFYLDASIMTETGLPGKGVFNPDFCLVGIAPSPNRPVVARLEPFSQATIKLMSRVTDLSDKTFYMTHLIKTPKPAKEKVYVRELRYWSPELFRELELIQPKRILAIGSEVAELLCPGFQNITSDHGVIFNNERLGCEVVPTYNLSTAMPMPDFATYVLRDVYRFFNLQVQPQPSPEVISSIDELPSLKNKEIIIDIESTGLTLNDKITKIGLSIQGQSDGPFWIIHDPSPEDIFVLGMKLSSETVSLIGHNAAFESFQLNGQDPVSLASSPWLDVTWKDTMLLVHNSGKHHSLGLKHLVTMETDHPGPHAFGGFEDDEYLVADLRGTDALYEKYQVEYQKPSGKLMCDLSGILGAMRARGVYIDLRQLDSVKNVIQDQWLGYAQILKESARGREINWNSSAQVAQVLIENDIPLTEHTKTGAFSTAEGTLEPFAEDFPLVQTLLDYKSLNKLITGFISPYLEMGTSYIYPSLLLNGTSTGRLSCKGPNLQQIPRQGPFKTIFKSRWHEAGGLYGLIDLSQAELRVVAMLSGDDNLAQALSESDAHRYIASLAFNKPLNEVTSTERKASKAITFGLVYGGSTGGLAKRAGLPKERVEEVLEVFFGQFPKLNIWLENYRERSNYANDVTTLFGRRRDLSLIRHYEGNNGVYRKAVNTPVQSVANDIMLWIIRYTWNELRSRGLYSRPMFAVHDSMLLEVYPGEQEIVTPIIQDAFLSLKDSPLSKLKLFPVLPIVGDVSYGPTWASLESTCVDFYDETLPSYHCSSI